jgi:hypothetical protein
MADEHAVTFTSGAPETALPALAPDRAAALADADAKAIGERSQALRAVAARWPDCLDAWASLAELTDDDVERYAFARVGYHRGLDQLRASGWRGSGLVRWRVVENRGFLRSLEALRRAAEAIGEASEATRCALFLRQLDPEWPPARSGDPR